MAPTSSSQQWVLNTCDAFGCLGSAWNPLPCVPGKYISVQCHCISVQCHCISVQCHCISPIPLHQSSATASLSNATASVSRFTASVSTTSASVQCHCISVQCHCINVQCHCSAGTSKSQGWEIRLCCFAAWQVCSCVPQESPPLQ